MIIVGAPNPVPTSATRAPRTSRSSTPASDGIHWLVRLAMYRGRKLRSVPSNLSSCCSCHGGTIGGSVAHADAAADLPASLLALDATFVVRGESGTRSVPAAEFFKGIFETALEPGELLTEIQVRKPSAPSAWSFQKFTKRAIDWAIVGVAVQGHSIALVNMGSTPLRATAAEAALAAGASNADAAALAADGTSAGSDIHATKAYREHLARVLVRRALDEAAARA